MEISCYETLDGTEHGGESNKTDIHMEVRMEESKQVLSQPDDPQIDEGSSTLQRLRILFDSSLPLVLAFFLSISGSFINLIFCGHLGALTQMDPNGPTPAQIFAGISLANMWANVTYKSIVIGLSGAIETLGSQNNGAGNFSEVGYTLQRGVFVLGITAIPCFLSWHYSGPFFSYIKIEPKVVEVIEGYLAIRAFEIPIGVFQTSFEKFLMSIGVMNPPLYGETHFNFSLVVLNLLFIYGKFGFGWRGLGYSMVLSCGAALGTQLATAWHHPSVQRALQPISLKEILDVKKLREFVDLGLPGMVMLMSEWIAYEVLSVFAGLLGTPEVAAQTIILSTAALVYMIPLGMGIATASLVGNALGAGKKGLAIEIARLAFLSVIVLEVILGIGIYFFGFYFVQLFTNDPNILRVAESAMSFLSLFVMVDGLNAIGSGVVRGCGKQFWAGVTNVFSYYLLGLPCAWLLCFNAGWNVKGLMMGLSVGTVAQSAALWFMIFYQADFMFTLTVSVGTATTKVKEVEAMDGEKRPPKSSFVISEIGDDDDEIGWD